MQDLSLQKDFQSGDKRLAGKIKVASAGETEATVLIPSGRIIADQ